MKCSTALTLFRLLVVAGLIAGPVAFAYHQRVQTRNFRVVREGVLYRSGQMTLSGLERIIHDYGIRTVITLRDAPVPGEPPPDLDEEVFCQMMDIRYVRIPPRAWEAPRGGGPPPVQEGVQRFLDIMADPRNQPVLVHCFAGVHRTGAYCAIYRMEFEGWSNADAMAEMKACGYENLDDEWDIRSYLEGYQPQGLLKTGVISPTTLIE
jgi:tyrosine-protein phosphatase SIW14